MGRGSTSQILGMESKRGLPNGSAKQRTKEQIVDIEIEKRRVDARIITVGWRKLNRGKQ